MENTYTNVATEIQGLAPVWQCNDCGAYADKPDKVKHHATCKPGESARWQKYYEEEDIIEAKENHYYDTRW
jgi:hypothetical protein